MHKFSKQVLTLVTGTLGSQLVTISLVPILARLYTPGHFGEWATFVAVSGLLSLVSAGRYDSAIILPQKIFEARLLAYISLCHISVFSSLVCLIMAAAWLVSSISSEHIGWSMLPISIFVCGCTQVFSSLLIRSKKYYVISQMRLMQSLSVAFVNLSLGYVLTLGQIQNGSTLLIFATILGQIIALFVAIRGIGSRRVTAIIYKSSYSMLHVKKYKDFPIFSAPESLLGSVLSNLPVYIFSYFLGSAIAGQYSLAQRCLMIPVAILGGAMSQINTNEFAQLSASNVPFQKELFKAWLRAACLAFFPILLLLIFSKQLFQMIFGSEWILAGEMATVMAFPIFILFVFTVGSGAHVVLRLQHFSLLAAIFSLVMKAIVILALINRGPLQMLAGLAVIDVILVTCMNSYVYSKANKVKK